MFMNGAFSNRQQAADGDADGTVLLSEASQDDRIGGIINRNPSISILSDYTPDGDIKQLSATPQFPITKNQTLSNLDDDVKLLQLVSEHLIQSIQYLSFHACHNNNTNHAQSDTEGDIPEENVLINATHSELQAPYKRGKKSKTFNGSADKSFSGSSGCSSDFSDLEKLGNRGEHDSSTFDSLEDLDEGEGDSLDWMTEKEASCGLSTTELHHLEVPIADENNPIKSDIHKFEEYEEEEKNKNQTNNVNTNEIKDQLINNNPQTKKKKHPLINRINKEFNKKFLPNSISEIGRISPLIDSSGKITSLPSNVLNPPIKAISTPESTEKPYSSNCTQQQQQPLQSLLILNQTQTYDDTIRNSPLHKSSQEGELTNSKKATKKKSILCSSKQQSAFSQIVSVRFDQNIEFCDTNLDLLKKHKELPAPQLQQQQQQQKAQEERKIIIQGWLMKKSSNRILNSYQKRYFVLSPEKLRYWSDEHCLKERGCINLKHLACSVSLSSNPTKLQLRIPEMRKILKLQEIQQGDISKWHKSISLAITANAKNPKLFLNNRQSKQQYKRDLITEKDMRQTAKTGDIILFDPINEIRDIIQQRDVALLVKFNSNDLRVFASINSQPPTLHHWETFLHDQRVFNQVLLRKIDIADRSQILPPLYESIQQQLQDNYKAKLKDAISSKEDENINTPTTPIKDTYLEGSKIKNIENSMRISNSSSTNIKQLTNSQILGQIFQRAGLIKISKKIHKFQPSLFGQNKRLKLLKEAKLSNEITVILNRQMYLPSQNNFD